MARRMLPVRERAEDPRQRLRPGADLEDAGPDGEEHRRFPRARVKERIELRIGPEKAPRFQATLSTANLSVSGAFLESTFFLPVGAELDVRFRLEEGGEEVMARAEVVRDERPDPRSGAGRSGMGIRFLSFEGQSEVALARLFVGARLRAFVEGYLKTARARKLTSELDRVVDALAAWELLQVSEPEDPWRPEGAGEPKGG